MKALSIKEPYSSWIMQGLKNIETRTWQTSYRGRLLIVASKIPKTDNSGLALCVVELVNTRLMKLEDMVGALCDYVPGKYSWILTRVRLIEKFPVKGQLNLFNVPSGKIQYLE